MREGERPPGRRSPPLDGWDGCLIEGLGCVFELLVSGCLPVLLLVASPLFLLKS